MEQMAKKRVPVTEEEKQKSYYKYFEQDMAQPAPEAYAKMLNGPLRPDQVLQFKDRNRLFEPGYLEAEAGWCIPLKTIQPGSARGNATHPPDIRI